MLDNFRKSLKDNKLPPPPPRKFGPEFSEIYLLLMLLATAGCLYANSTPDKVEARRIEFPTLGAPT